MTSRDPASVALPQSWTWDEELQSFVRVFGKKAGFCVSINLLRQLLATRGYVVERLCPEHGRRCWDARCDVRDR